MGKPFLQFLYNEEIYFSCRKCKNHVANGKYLCKKNNEKTKTTGILSFKKLVNIKNVNIKKKYPLYLSLQKSNLIYCLKCDMKIGMIKNEKNTKELFSVYSRSIIQNNLN